MDNTKTVKAHLEACRNIESLIRDSNSLVEVLQRNLAAARTSLEAMTDYQHPKVGMQIPAHLRSERESYDARATPTDVIARQIAVINSVLGDRA